MISLAQPCGKPARSCQTTIDEMHSAKVETIEGLSDGGQLHPVQEAFIKEGAMQCGYCVPGMIMATVGLLRRNPKATATEIITGLNGNICRCCGYGNIVKAIEQAVQTVKEEK